MDAVIRQAEPKDICRIAEIIVYNNRQNFYPIFRDIRFSFAEVNVFSVAEEYRQDKNALASAFVYEQDEVIKGFVRVEKDEIKKLYVDTFFQNQGIGSALIEFAKSEKNARTLWALEKNTGAIRFYRRHGFFSTGEKVFEEGTTEYLLRLSR